MKSRILLIEDDQDLARGLRFNLEHEGFDVQWCAAGREGLDAARQEAFDVVLLDLSLPDLDGTEVLRALRREGASVPVICLTARGAEADVVMGLDLGADDYVTKPFGLAQLFARINAVRRRVPREAQETLSLGDVQVDLRAHRATGPGGVQELTPIETDILRYLAARRGVAVDRLELLKKLWGVDHRGETRTLDNHVARLRRKVEADPARPRWLLTVHGVGYRLD